jgi:subtilisin
MTDESDNASPLTSRRERYLVAPIPAQLLPAGVEPGAGPLDPAAVLAEFERNPACDVRKVIPSKSGSLSTFGASAGEVVYPQVLAVEMDADYASLYNSNPMLHVEPDLPVRYAEPTPVVKPAFVDPGTTPSRDQAVLEFLVTDTSGNPLADAEVYIMSSMLPGSGVTGPDGRVEIRVPSGSLATTSGLYVKPAANHWSLWQRYPQLVPGVLNTVQCRPLTETLSGFPERQACGWARTAMRLDALPPTYRGHGVKIAIIDSGTEADHPDLAGRIAGGIDIAGASNDGWRVDRIGHGTHCAGIVGGSDNGAGIVGIVPEAEIHSCKIFPGGRFSDLIEALDYCIANQIDVANLSLGSPEPSQLVQLKIEEARQAGVACVVAAGNSAGPVAFPASLSNVLAVAAIGKTGECPPDSYHATQIHSTITPEGYFSAKFTCFGPEIDVCAPGVAIVSSVPDGYAANDGTSFAAPYVAALAALLLAHHPDFHAAYARRNAARVDRLLEIIRGSCRPIAVGGPERAGAGIPDAALAFGTAPPGVALGGAPSFSTTGDYVWDALVRAGGLGIPQPPQGAQTAMGLPRTGTATPFATGSGSPGPLLSTMTFAGLAPGEDPMAPLRTAMRSGGLLTSEAAAAPGGAERGTTGAVPTNPVESSG